MSYELALALLEFAEACVGLDSEKPNVMSDADIVKRLREATARARSLYLDTPDTFEGKSAVAHGGRGHGE
jgi:hypothetical protein